MSADAQSDVGSRSPTASLVMFAFGASGVPHGETLAGPVLLQVLADLGLSTSAARAAILRLRRERWLTSTRRGREAQYALAPAVVSVERRLERQFTGPGPGWDGSFHAVLYEVAEADRPFRDALRRTALLAGYGTLRPGLLVAPSDRWAELAPALEHVPRSSLLLRARLSLSPADSRQIAREIWELDDLAERYRTLAKGARRASAQGRRRPPAGADALRALAAAVRPLYDAIARDPDLPEELLPPAWPRAEIGAALGEALGVLGPLVHAHVAEIRRHHSVFLGRAPSGAQTLRKSLAGRASRGGGAR